jgi:hypothetical protein
MAVATLGLKHTPVRRSADHIGSQTHKFSWQYWPTTDVDQPGFTNYRDRLADVLDRPDLEDDTKLVWGLAQSEAHLKRGPRANVDVLYGEGTDLRKLYQT